MARMIVGKYFLYGGRRAMLRAALWSAFCTLVLAAASWAAVGVSPQYVFYDGTRKSIPVTITNPSDQDVEIHVKAVAGYVISDENGTSVMMHDSANSSLPSSARWVQFYPTQFLLRPHEAQTVRVVALAPAGVPEGEYWARLVFASRNSKDRNRKTTGSGVVVLQAVAIPFHYRIGKLSTGLEVSEMHTSSDSGKIIFSMAARRTGNAAYWGAANFRITDKSGKIVVAQTRNVAVYTDFSVRFAVDKAVLPPGDYKVDVKYETRNRTDVPDAKLVQASPVLIATDVSLH